MGARERSLAAFRSAPFRRFQTARLLGVLGMQMMVVAIGWQVYDLSHSTFDLGLVGGAQFLPLLLTWPFAGVVADRFDRRRVALAAWSAFLLCELLLFAATWTGQISVGTILGVSLLLGTARSFSAAAGPALLPMVVPEEDFPSAAAWSSTAFSVGVIVGPALGGIAYAWAGDATGAYGLAIVLHVAAVVALWTVVPLRSGPPAARSQNWQDALAGLRIVWQHPILFGAISLDLFAVFLGGAVALLPVYARDVFHLGPEGLGLLRASPAVGATAMAVWLSGYPPQRRIGWWLYATVGVFGLATIAFGLTTDLVSACICLVAVGASDQISVWIRQNVVQLATPDAYRGRVSAVEYVFIGASNELGEFESGMLASAVSPVWAVVGGGLGTLAVVGASAVATPHLRKLDRLDDLRGTP